MSIYDGILAELNAEGLPAELADLNMVEIVSTLRAVMAAQGFDESYTDEVVEAVERVAMQSFLVGIVAGHLRVAEAGEKHPDLDSAQEPDNGDSLGLVIPVAEETLEAFALAAIREGGLTFTLVAARPS